MTKLCKPQQVMHLMLLACMVYFSSYITRINFSAIIVEFISAEGVAKTSASLITSVTFITYGAGQLISGYLGDRISPRLLIFAGLLTAAAANVVLPLCSPNIPVMAVAWGVNGMAQAFMWPPLVKILKSALTDDDYGRVVPFISISASAATILIYLVSPILIHMAGWKSVLAVCAPVGAAAAVIWLCGTRQLISNVELLLSEKHNERSSDTKEHKDSLWSILPVILLTICLQGMLRDGISTWTPNLMAETFHLASTVSILTGVALPLFQIAVNISVYRILKKLHMDVFACIILFFAIISVLLLGLSTVGFSSAILSLLLIALVNGIVHGINLLQTSYIPAMFHNSRNISFLAGMLNASTYVGSALATWLFAALSERLGWNITVWSWVTLAVGGNILTAVCRRFHQKTK